MNNSQKIQPSPSSSKEWFLWMDIGLPGVFESLKKAMVGTQVTAYLTNDGDFILDTDTSIEMIGVVLSHVQDGVEHLIAYGSRNKWNYCFVKYYKHYSWKESFQLEHIIKPWSGCTVWQNLKTQLIMGWRLCQPAGSQLSTNPVTSMRIQIECPGSAPGHMSAVAHSLMMEF